MSFCLTGSPVSRALSMDREGSLHRLYNRSVTNIGAGCVIVEKGEISNWVLQEKQIIFELPQVKP